MAEKKSVTIIQVVMSYTSAINTMAFESEEKARVAIGLLNEQISKGKYRNDPDVIQIEHDGGVAVYRSSEIAAVTLSNGSFQKLAKAYEASSMKEDADQPATE